MSRSKRGEKPWSGKPPLSGLGSKVSPARIDRKLEDIHQGLVTLGSQGKTKGFFNNVENADKLGSLVEDVRDVMMDYQVRASNGLSLPCSSVLQTSLQQDMYNRSFLLIVSLIPSYFLPGLVTDWPPGISGPCTPGQDVSHPECRVSVWEQARVFEGNPKGCSVGNRTLVDWRTGTECLLVEWARRNGEINHCPDGGRDRLRGRKTRSELLLLARFLQSEQPPGNLPDARLPTCLPTSRFPEGATPGLEGKPRCCRGVSLLAAGDARCRSTRCCQHFNPHCH